MKQSEKQSERLAAANEGLTADEMAQRFGKTKNWARKWLKNNGFPTPIRKKMEIDNSPKDARSGWLALSAVIIALEQGRNLTVFQALRAANGIGDDVAC